MIEYVHAGVDPISLFIASEVFVFLAPVIGPGAAGLLADVVGAIFLPAALSGAALALSPKLPNVPQPGAAKETFTASDAPEMRAIGRVRVGGLIAFGNSYQNRRYRLYCHAKGEIDGFEAFYLGGREVVIAGDGTVRSFPWRIDNTSYAELLTDVGTSAKTAWPDLLADFTGMWTSNHRLRGIAQTLAKFINPGLDDPLFLELYQGGVPKLESEFRGEKLYDPRSAATAWSDNGVLAALHLLLTLYTTFSLADFDTAQIEDEADRADALVAQKVGANVARSRAWGVWTSETPRGDTMQALLDSVGVEIVPRAAGAKLGLQLIDDAPASELTIAAKHIVGLTWRDGPEGVARPNRCTLSYYSPERNYDKGEIDLTGIGWAKVQDEIDAYGEQKLDIVLPFCPHAGQAQRRARQIFALARTQTGVVRTNLAGLAAFGCRYVTFEFPDDLGSVLTRIGAPRVLDDEGVVEIPFQVWPTLSAWNTATDEADAPEQLPDPGLGNALTTPAAPDATVVVVTYPDASTATRVKYTVPADAAGDPALIEASYRPTNNGRPPIWRNMTEYRAERDGIGPAPTIDPVDFAFVGADQTGVECDFRLRTRNNFDGSAWSNTRRTTPVAVNTAPGVPEIVAVDDGTTVKVWVTAPADLHVASLHLVDEVSTITDMAINPAEQILFDTFVKPPPLVGTPQTFTWQARARASDGTQSSIVSDSITIPAA